MNKTINSEAKNATQLNLCLLFCGIMPPAYCVSPRMSAPAARQVKKTGENSKTEFPPGRFAFWIPDYCPMSSNSEIGRFAGGAANTVSKPEALPMA